MATRTRTVTRALCLALVIAAAHAPVARADPTPVFCILVEVPHGSCYAPADEAVAAARMTVPPVSPVAIASQAITLPLDMIEIVLNVPRATFRNQPITPPPLAHAIIYLFGTNLSNGQPDWCLIPNVPPFVRLDESVGSYDVSLGAAPTATSCPDGSRRWSLAANIPGRELALAVTSNMSAQIVQTLAQQIVAYAATLPPVPTATVAAPTPTLTPTATAASTPAPTPAPSATTRTAATPSPQNSLAVRVRITPHAVAVGDVIDVRVQTAPHARLSLTVARLRNKQPPLRLFDRQGTADARGRFAARIRVSDRATRPFKVVVTVRVRVGRKTSARSLTVLLTPSQR